MYYIKIIDSIKIGNEVKSSTWYYYGWKSYLGCKVRDLYDSLCEDVKTYKSRKTAESVAEKIVEEHSKGYPWMSFSHEIAEM